MRKGENRAGFQDQGSAYRVQPPNGIKKPFQTVGDDHGGDYNPERYKVASSDRNIDHGGDYNPERYKVTSSDRNIDHGGDYIPQQWKVTSSNRESDRERTKRDTTAPRR